MTMYEVVITHPLAVITEKPPVITVGAYVATAVITEEKKRVMPTGHDRK